MRRFFLDELQRWRVGKKRKPLIVRGLRQTGKTWCLREFGQREFPGGLRLVDFEQSRKWSRVFEPDLDPKRICAELELLIGSPLKAGETLLVLDEIQHCPRALMALRYFYEEMPELHVAAAGSLLDFVLEDISFPVGRVQFLDLFPLSFREYLLAVGKTAMSDLLAEPPQPLAPTVHEELLRELRRYWLVGGMPGCVATWLETNSVLGVRQELENLLISFRQDFSKYSPRVDRRCLENVWESAAKAIGTQIVYTRLDTDFSGATNRRAFQVLATARLLRAVPAASAAGSPLREAAVPRIKPLLGDIGFLQAPGSLLAPDEWSRPDLLAIYRGAVAEQYVGQEIIATGGLDKLYWWKREAKNSTAEVDYLIETAAGIQPIEVKSGSSGSLKSMHQLLRDHPDCRDGIVFSCAPYAVLPQQRLRFIPVYYAGMFQREATFRAARFL